jgi:hypothetical protein
MRRIKVTLSPELEAKFPSMSLEDQMGLLRNMCGRTASIWTGTNEYFGREPSEYDKFERCLEGGRDYLVGSVVSMAAFRRTHRSTPILWQRLACIIAWVHPETAIHVEIPFPRLEYDIKRRGEYVDIGLPHQDAGGEKNWIAVEPFRSKFLVNVD